MLDMIPIKKRKRSREDARRRAARRATFSIASASLIRPGITTKEVDEAAADFMHEAEREERIPRLSARAPRFSGQHLHFAQRRSGSRHRQASAGFNTAIL